MGILSDELEPLRSSPLISPTGYSVTTNGSGCSSGLGLRASAEGVSVVHLKNSKALLLGNAKNALCAIENEIPGWDVTHVICVASNRNADLLRASASGMMVRWLNCLTDPSTQ